MKKQSCYKAIWVQSLGMIALVLAPGLSSAIASAADMAFSPGQYSCHERNTGHAADDQTATVSLNNYVFGGQSVAFEDSLSSAYDNSFYLSRGIEADGSEVAAMSLPSGKYTKFTYQPSGIFHPGAREVSYYLESGAFSGEANILLGVSLGDNGGNATFDCSRENGT